MLFSWHHHQCKEQKRGRAQRPAETGDVPTAWPSVPVSEASALGPSRGLPSPSEKHWDCSPRCLCCGFPSLVLPSSPLLPSGCWSLFNSPLSEAEAGLAYKASGLPLAYGVKRATSSGGRDGGGAFYNCPLAHRDVLSSVLCLECRLLSPVPRSFPPVTGSPSRGLSKHPSPGETFFALLWFSYFYFPSTPRNYILGNT